MRILHLTDRASERGGADRHLLSVLDAQSEREHELILAVGRVERADVPCDVVVVQGLDAAGRQPLAAALDALADRFTPDVVHIHNALSPDALRWAARRGAVATVQDHRSFCPGRGKLIVAAPGAAEAGEEPSMSRCREPMSRQLCTVCFDDGDYQRRIHDVTDARLAALRDMAAVTVLSAYMRDELTAVGVKNAEVIAPFVHGIDPSAEPDGPPCILFAGRLVQAKGVLDAVEAWRRAATDLPLVLAGSGSLRAALEGTDAEVLGWVPHHRMSAIYRRARALLMPSRWQEPFGIVGLEALSVGVPVVAWDSGGVASWHPGDDLLVPWGDVDGLASALRRAIDRRARPTSGFDRTTLMDRLERVYADARDSRAQRVDR